MYAAVAPPSSLTEGVRVEKKDEPKPSGLVSNAMAERVKNIKMKSAAATRQLQREASRTSKPPPTTRKRKEPEPPSAEEEQEKEKDREKDREKEEEKRKKNPLVLEMMKSYFNPNPQLRGVPEGPLAQKTELEEQIEAAIRKHDYEEADALNEQLAKHKNGMATLQAIECVNYTIAMRKEEEAMRDKKQPMLNWTFNPKLSWERKGNM